jgi:hypothetical protein
MKGYPKFSINGVELDGSQNMTMWVALQNLGLKMEEDPTNLGTDEHGMAMSRGYLKSVREINRIAFTTTP